MELRVIRIALARFFCKFLGSLHAVQPHQGPRQLELAVPGVAIQLKSSTGEGFGSREALVVRKERGQAEERLMAALAEVGGFLQIFLTPGGVCRVRGVLAAPVRGSVG